MEHKNTLLTTALLLGCLTAYGPATRALADQPLTIPASQHFEHEELLTKLTTLAARPAPVGPAAQNLLDVVKPHLLHEEEVLLPPLTLLPLIADGKVSPSMKWALPLIDRVQAEHPADVKVDQQITAQLLVLFAAADQANDEPAARLAREIAADLLHDDEVTEPTVLMLGEYLRARLAASE